MSDTDVTVRRGRRVSQTSSDLSLSQQQQPLDTPGRPSQDVIKSPTRASTYSLDPHLDSLPEARRESRRMSDNRRVSQYVPPGVALSQRRPSMWYRRSSVASSHRMTTTSDPNGIPRVLFENTYQLGPTKEQRFRAKDVQTVASQILQSFLDGEQYDHRKCAKLSQTLTEVILARIKEFGMRRHKLVCIVLIGQSGGQTIRYASRCVWDRETDRYATATFQNSSLFATATVFAVYYE